MIRGFYIDSVLNLVEGGDVNDQNDVWREDIAALLPAAVNYANVGAMFDQSNMEHDRDVPNTFVVPFVNISVSTLSNGVGQFTLPTVIVSLPSDRGIRLITSPQGDNVYQIMNDNLYANWNYYKNIMLGQRFFRVIGTTINLYNKPSLETQANVYVLQDASAYADTDELPVVAGKEIVCIQELFKLFSKQRAEAQQNIQFKSDFNK